jgi:hypothetical protein
MIFGAFAEFVRVIHHLAHGGSMKEYPPRREAAAAGPEEKGEGA